MSFILLAGGEPLLRRDVIEIEGGTCHRSTERLIVRKRHPRAGEHEPYTDEGITGTSTQHRDGFNQKIGDAQTRKIDLIVTKSVSRFARNTVDTHTTIRNLNW